GLRDLVETVKRESDGQTQIFIQIIDFLSVKRRPEKEKYFATFFTVKRPHRQRLAEATSEDRWLEEEDAEVRAFLKNAPDAILDRVLDEREIESLRYGYRERVTDMDLPHIKDLPKVLPEIFAS